MTKALATVIEDDLAAAIFDFTGITGTNPDPDLPSAQRCKEVTGGYLPLEQDYQKGPLIRLMVGNITKWRDEVGNGDARSMIEYFAIRMIGISAPNSSIKAAADTSKLLEEIVRLRLLRTPLDQYVSEAVYQKSEYAALLVHVKTDFDISSTGQSNLTHVGFFTLDCLITDEGYSS